MSRQQRLTTWMAAAAVMIGSLGVPLSTQRAARTGEAFPCQNCACGCSSAATCWRDCCCYSNAQKLIWAEKNGVKVPIFVVAAARRDQAKTAAKADCCRDQSGQGSCESTCAADASDACTGPSCCDQRSRSSSESGSQIVLLMNALKCRGISVSVGWLPPSLPPLFSKVDGSIIDLGPLHSGPAPLYHSPHYDVATPPPDSCELLGS